MLVGGVGREGKPAKISQTGKTVLGANHFITWLCSGDVLNFKHHFFIENPSDSTNNIMFLNTTINSILNIHKLFYQYTNNGYFIPL